MYNRTTNPRRMQFRIPLVPLRLSDKHGDISTEAELKKIE